MRSTVQTRLFPCWLQPLFHNASNFVASPTPLRRSLVLYVAGMYYHPRVDEIKMIYITERGDGDDNWDSGQELGRR